ncbi:MAG: ycgJ [Nocardioides sp.]|nr:ycgJ [Nocardioides sp.]
MVPRLTDRALSVGQVMKLREQTCAGLAGRVLEIGFGSGLNIEKYPAAVTSADAVEPSDVGWALSESRRSATGVPVHRVGLDGQHLAADDATYDAVLCTFSLCTIPDAALALAEVRRVLTSGGMLHLLEHGRSPDAGVARWQRRLEPVQRRVFGGCHLTRDVPVLVRAAGLDVVEVHQGYLPGPRVGRPWGWATRLTATA